MRMSEALAGTVAQIAPVVLLVIIVEIAGNRDRMVDQFRDAGRSVALTRSMARRDSLTPTQRARAQRAITDQRRNVGAVGWLLFYLAVSAAVAVLLLDAEWRAIQWLADPHAGPAPQDALFCTRVIGFAFLRIVMGPIISLLQPLVDGLAQLLPGMSSTSRLQRLLDRSEPGS
ncbi:hypothetical protein [Streptomyces sp. NPDC059215]|uniref:hypothetical protein n=1 Tax=Streptomyces sp. NPDC059215 TaxID=3346772 RepID=UPI0036885BD1